MRMLTTIMQRCILQCRKTSLYGPPLFQGSSSRNKDMLAWHFTLAKISSALQGGILKHVAHASPHVRPVRRNSKHVREVLSHCRSQKHRYNPVASLQLRSIPFMCTLMFPPECETCGFSKPVHGKISNTEG